MSGTLTIDGLDFPYFWHERSVAKVGFLFGLQTSWFFDPFTGLDGTCKMKCSDLFYSEQECITLIHGYRHMDEMSIPPIQESMTLAKQRGNRGTYEDVHTGILYSVSKQGIPLSKIEKFKQADVWPEPTPTQPQTPPLNLSEQVTFEYMQKINKLDAGIKTSPTHWKVFEWYVVDQIPPRQMRGKPSTIRYRKQTIENAIKRKLSAIAIDGHVFKNVRAQLNPDRLKQKNTDEDDFFD